MKTLVVLCLIFSYGISFAQTVNFQSEYLKVFREQGGYHPRMQTISNYMDLISGFDPNRSCDIPKIK